MTSTVDPFAQALEKSIAVLATGMGFQTADTASLATLTEMAKALLAESGRGAQRYAEHAGRTQIYAGDVALTLVDQGLPLQQITHHVLNPSPSRSSIAPPLKTVEPPPQAQLRVGRPSVRPQYISEHLPPYPDPHTYLKSDAPTLSGKAYAESRRTLATHSRAVNVSIVEMTLRAAAQSALQTFRLRNNRTKAFQLLPPDAAKMTGFKLRVSGSAAQADTPYTTAARVIEDADLIDGAAESESREEPMEDR